MHAWDKAVGNWRHVRVTRESCEVVVQEGSCDGEPLACTDKLGGSVVTLVPGRYEGARESILLHELGHVLGAQHVGGTLMSPTYERGYTCPDVYTVVQVAAYQKANLEYFSWCM